MAMLERRGVVLGGAEDLWGRYSRWGHQEFMGEREPASPGGAHVFSAAAQGWCKKVAQSRVH